MSAKRDGLSKIQEIYDVVLETQRQIAALAITKERFCNPSNDSDDLIAEGIMNRVLRVTEEAGHLSDEATETYGFDRSGVKGVRNRLAHAYGEVDKDIIWDAIEHDFPALIDACVAFCDDRGLEL